MVAAIRQRHDSQLRHVVARRATPDTATVTRACRDAWTQLVNAQHIDLHPPRWSALAWVTTRAIQRAHALAQQADRNADRVAASAQDRTGVMR
jgi:hypothetical protein